MRAGAIVETGPVAGVFADPQHPYTRTLFEALLDDAPTRAPFTDTPEAAR